MEEGAPLFSAASLLGSHVRIRVTCYDYSALSRRIWESEQMVVLVEDGQEHAVTGTAT